MNTSSVKNIADQGLIDTSSYRSLTTSATEHLVSPYYQVDDFGFLVLTSTEQYPDTWYPTPSDIVPGGWFTIDIHNATYGDFNGDGLQDLLIQPMLFPHVVPRETRLDSLFLLQQPDGSFANPRQTLDKAKFPEKFFEYRLGVGDFNGDGIDDVSIATMDAPGSTNAQDLSSRFSSAESPVTVYGGKNSLTWTDTYKGLPLFQGAPNWQIGYSTGHSMAVGDFNGDGLSDWASNGYVAYSLGNSFEAQRYVPNASAANKTSPWESEWVWPTVNAYAAADFNEDGYDDLIYSTMPRQDNGALNGGDLYLMLGSESGLKEGRDVIQIPRTNSSTDNIGTNFMVAADFNGDGHQDLLFLEHGWVTDGGDSSHYYSQAKFRVFLGDGKGGLSESARSIEDPYSGRRTGEGNLFAVDVNGDGWIDLVSSGYAYNSSDTWGGASKDVTSVFINQQGKLIYTPSSNLAYVESYQFAGEEGIKEFSQSGVGKMFPVDLGNDGLVDFVGFVSTPLHQWPQVEQTYTYAYVSRAVLPLGRIDGSENLIGTMGNDKIYGFAGNDILAGQKGNDSLNGGNGTDTAKYSGLSNQYKINGQMGTLTDTQENRDGVDTLFDIERLQFADINVALDIEKGDVAGSAYRLYKAAFDRLPEAEGLGFWINSLDQGANLVNVAQGFINSDEFRVMYGANPTDQQFVTLLYNHVLHRPPEGEGYQFWLNSLSAGVSRAQVLKDFSESTENINQTVDLIANGIQYDAWQG